MVKQLRDHVTKRDPALAKRDPALDEI